MTFCDKRKQLSLLKLLSVAKILSEAKNDQREGTCGQITTSSLVPIGGEQTFLSTKLEKNPSSSLPTTYDKYTINIQ